MNQYTLSARRGRLVRTPMPLQPIPGLRAVAASASALVAAILIDLATDGAVACGITAALALMGGTP